MFLYPPHMYAKVMRWGRAQGLTDEAEIIAVFEERFRASTAELGDIDAITVFQPEEGGACNATAGMAMRPGPNLR